ncbi:alpha-glucosidase [Lacisediminimonas profundi]|uniref:alpha-glucosidase n=1 Tax=Lacisediminimonas profundi TaxID=2603856 RepID=UPI00124B751A|nr:alpha-glucosidase [Lacisediminimonas profundi]
MQNRSDSAPARKDWWRGALIYQVYPRSFQDSDGDGVGDLPGLVARLDYIASLGVDAIWVSPFFRSPMKDYGYDVQDYRDVDPLFGTLDDFLRLLERAHELGLRIIIDQVISHTSDQHPWFVESRSSHDNPKADWYVWADPKPDGTPPNNWQSVFGGTAWQWDARRRQYYLHNFLSSQPDLNFHHPAVRSQVLDDVRFWCRHGVDGFRFDASNFHFHDRQLRDNPPAAAAARVASVRADNPYSMQRHVYDKNQPENIGFLRDLRRVLDECGAVSLGEVGDEDALTLMAAYTGDGDKLHMAYSFNLLTPEFSAAHIRAEVEELEWRIKKTGGWGCWSLSNHDVARVLSRWGKEHGDRQLAKTLLAMVCSLRGSACIYQGEELGLTEADIPFESLRDPYGINFWPEFKGRDGCRTPMPWSAEDEHGGFSPEKPWLPVPAEHLTLSVSGQQADPGSVLNFFRNFTLWRRSQAPLVSGDIQFLDAPEPVLMFRRTLDGEEILAAFNLGPKPVRVRVPAGVTGFSAVAGHGLAGELQGDGKLLLGRYDGFFGKLRQG